jgi:capsular polysaccharide biosynthesis protein
MQNNGDNRGVKLSARIYGYLLALYPSGYRREFGPAMMQLFRDQSRDARRAAGGWGLAALWLRTLPDLARSSVREQFAEWRNRSAFVRVFAIVFGCSVACAVIVANLFPVPYSSTVKITVHRDFQNSPNFLLTQCKIIQSYAILTNAITTLHLDEKLAKQNHENRWAIDQTFDYLAGNISVKLHRETGVIDVSVKNRDPVLAAKMADVIASTYCNDAYSRAIEAVRAAIGRDEDALSIAEREFDHAHRDFHNGIIGSNALEIFRGNSANAKRVAAEARKTYIMRMANSATSEHATPALPVIGTLKILLISLGAGSLVALVAGSVGGWISLAKRKPAQ